jgi:hypothetical protein
MVDTMKQSEVTTAEQNRDMANFSQETPTRNHEHSGVESESVIQMNLSKE